MLFSIDTILLLFYNSAVEYYFSLFEEPFKYFLSVCCCSCSCNQVGLRQIRILINLP